MGNLKSVGEIIFDKYLNLLFSDFFIKKNGLEKPEILINTRPKFMDGLELDFYIPEYGMAFEFQGDQHFQPAFHTGLEGIKKRLLYDAIKKDLALKNNVIVIDIIPRNLFNHIKFKQKVIRLIKIALATKKYGLSLYSVIGEDCGPSAFFKKFPVKYKECRIDVLYNNSLFTIYQEIIDEKLSDFFKLNKFIYHIVKWSYLMEANIRSDEQELKYRLTLDKDTNKQVAELLKYQNEYDQSFPMLGTSDFDENKYHGKLVRGILKHMNIKPESLLSLDRNFI